jgi:alkylated DNA repair protein (DNA oxidative demethylase)
MPNCFLDLAVGVAAEAGYAELRPDAYLINRYEPGARLSLHLDKNQRDLADPRLRVARFAGNVSLGGQKRNDPVKKFALRHGDVAVWGGPSRLCYHGVSELKDDHRETVGSMRINLTFWGAL